MILLNVQTSNLDSVIKQQLKERKLLCADTGVVLTQETISIWDEEYLSKEAYRARIETLDALAELNQN